MPHNSEDKSPRSKQVNTVMQLLQGAVFVIAVYGYFQLLGKFLDSFELSNLVGAFITIGLIALIIWAWSKSKRQ